MARILYVEDEPDIRSDVVEELVDSGYTISAATDGTEGLQMALDVRPDIILCDCLMPGMTGPEMVRRLRAEHPEFDSVPVVFLSAHADQAHQDEGLAAGAKVYLTKPVDFDELEGVLETLLGAAAAG